MISIYCSVLLKKKKEEIKKKKEEKGREICGDINILVCRVRSVEQIVDRILDNSRREGRKSKERGVRRKKIARILRSIIKTVRKQADEGSITRDVISPFSRK